MSINELWPAVTLALDLLVAFPGSWLLFIAAFIVIAESLMFIPYIGFTLKMIVASLVGAQGFVFFREAASGVRPDLTGLFDAFALPPLAQASIVLSGLVPLMIGLLYLQYTAGWSATKFFFGNILKAKPPDAKLFERFKYIMQFAAAPFAFIAPLVVLGGVHDQTAFARGLLLGLQHWPLLLLMLGVTVAFEWAAARTTETLPKKFALPVLGVSAFLFIAWTLAFSYSLYEAIGPVSP